MAGRHTPAAVADRYGKHSPEVTGNAPIPALDRGQHQAGDHRTDAPTGTMPSGEQLVQGSR